MMAPGGGDGVATELYHFLLLAADADVHTHTLSLALAGWLGLVWVVGRPPLHFTSSPSQHGCLTDKKNACVSVSTLHFFQPLPKKN